MKKKGKYGDTTINLVVKAIIALGGSATEVEVDGYLKKTIQNYVNDTRPNIINITVNVNRSYWKNNMRARRSDDESHPDHRYDRLFKQGNVYTLYNPVLHGVWEIFEESPDVWRTRQVVPGTEQEIRKAFEIEVEMALKLTSEQRRIKITESSVVPQVKEVITKVFIRNAYVVAEVRKRANGICQKCGSDAPFLRVKDGTPYLEVHHKIPLADGGEDTIDNTIALCPNCHRHAHYGVLTSSKT